MSTKKSHKQQERKRKEQLQARANIDAFRTQLEMKIRDRFPELGTDRPAVVAEMDAICAAGLAEGMIVLGKMVTGIRTEMGVNPEADKGSLIGAIVPYVLGITMENPIENGQLDTSLADAAVDFIARQSYNPQYGARPVKRMMQRELLNSLSKMILAESVDKAQTIIVDVQGNGLVFRN